MYQSIILKEWDTVFLKDAELSDNEARITAQILNNEGILEITEQKQGVLIKSNSYVGRVKIGDFQLNVYPKIDGMPLYRLLRYAYGLRDLKLFNMAEHSLNDFSFFDLLIYELYVEAEDLLRRGIYKNYIQKEDDLISPRGKINIDKLCARGD